MIAFEKNNNELVEFFIDKQEIEIYVLRSDLEVIGYAKINNDVNNKIQIYVLPKHRGQGYGKKIFEYALKTIVNETEIYITLSTDNLIAKRIVEKSGGKQHSIDNGTVKYILPIASK